MTALAGFWSFGGSAGAGAACERMLEKQRVYAPDPAICRTDGAVAVGRRLFGTLPEDRFDRGPVAGGDGRRLLVADLRLDNRGEMIAALGLAAAEAATLADSGLLMRALDRWDAEAVDRLAGEFAFALWDGAGERLLLARDFLGQRPLHYHRGAGFFAFASMPKGLHALAEIPVAPNRRTAADFLALRPQTGTETFFEGVEKVPSGHVVTVTRDGLSSRNHWAPPSRPLRLARPEDYAEALRERLDAAVASCLRGADGHVAAQLSGGLDSGAVAATAARLLAPGGGRVTAFTSVPRRGYRGGLRHSISDEGPLAAAVADLYPNMEHVRISAGGRSPLAALDRNYRLYDSPILNLCNAVWSDAILDAVEARALPVMLSGTMGNMSLSYDGMQLLPQLLAGGRLLRLAKEISRLVANGARIGTVAAQTLGPFLPRTVWNGIGRLRGRGGGASGFSANDPAGADDRGGSRPRLDSVAARLWTMRRIDGGNFRKGILGGWGISYRDPTADRRLVEFCLSVPEDLFLARGTPRALAREALADRLPPSVVGERRKGYQAADWHEGLSAARAELGEEIARLAASPAAAEALDTARMARLVEQWPDDWHEPGTTGQYRHALLRAVSAGHFLRRAAGSGR